jgi:hypothetical protein
LLSDIDRLWDERPIRRGLLRERVAALTARAEHTRERLGRLLDELDPQPLAGRVGEGGVA